MACAVRHRGPDDETFWRSDDGAIGFAHRRLSIIDIAGGRQPMQNEDGSVIAICNGEIYNYRELRDELAARGHILTTNSDTETIVHLYEEFGAALAPKLRGMFAIAVWDARARQLLLFRDRVGKKPLYYREIGGEFLFASEIKSIIAAAPDSVSVEPAAIREYLTWGMISAPRTIYRDIRSVEPGHGLVIRDACVVRKEPYWRLTLTPKVRVTREEAVERIDHGLQEAVRLRLRSDVPVGVFLSGGIDSGLVTAMAARQHTEALTTITIGFENAGLDERPLARQVAARYHTDHHEVVLHPDIVADLPGIIAAYDQPFGDSSAVPAFYVARAARQFVKVVLNGDGGDELFAGYRRYVAAMIAGRMGPLSAAAFRPIWSILSSLLPRQRGFRTSYAYAHRFIRGLSLPRDRRIAAWTIDGFDFDALQSLGWRDCGDNHGAAIGRPADNERLVADVLAECSDCGPVDRMLAFDFSTVLPNDLLVKMDIASMRHSLEARSPMLDHELIETVGVLPESFKLNGFTTKPLLRTLAARYLPDEICRAPKRGFEVPVVDWLRNELRDLSRDAILARQGLLSELFDRSRLERFAENVEGLDPARWGRRMWLLLALGIWDAHRRGAPRVEQPTAAVSSQD
jgi:asparagine synthase (glutamine-hydrolysing)